MSSASNAEAPTKRRIAEAVDILKQLGLPKQQQNDRSGLTLLALLDLRPTTPWKEAQQPTLGIHDMLGFFAEAYQAEYAENTRETVRRQTLHQFMQAGIVAINPDDPKRSINSPKTVYQIPERVLTLIRTYGAGGWDEALPAHLAGNAPLIKRYRKERRLAQVPAVVGNGREITLTPGAHSVLVKAILEEFVPRFIPGGTVLYVGDTGKKFAHIDENAMRDLWIELDPHGKIPDVILHDRDRNWLILIEAVTSHGPIDAKRHIELNELFRAARAGLVYVTAFPSRSAMAKYLGALSWETEVWAADEPDHLMHFNGERFLGPHSGQAHPEQHSSPERS